MSVLALSAALLTGCAAGSTTANNLSASRTPAPTATPQVLYQADFSGRASTWNVADGWRLTSGGLANSGHSTTTMVIPYTPAVANYTITMTIKVNAVVGPSACGNEFGLEGQTPGGEHVWDAVIACIDSRYHGESEMYCSNVDGGMGTWDYATGVSPRTYVVNVVGQYVSYSPSGQDLGTSHCALPTSPLKLVLLNSGVDTIIQSITITTP
jgi:hypothetical protein